MAKVFRLHSGSNAIQDWQNSTIYGNDVIARITDPDGATARKEITSIPSPFARMDLVKTAFGEVAKAARPEGNTIYHKMVSDSLDVAEIFFNAEKLKDKIEILAWDKTDELNRLKNNSLHSFLGETLRTFLTQDATTYHFDRMQRIYLLNYTGPDRPASLNIIGATSPATLFFSSANDLSYVSPHIAFGQNRPFDDKYQPLYLRDPEFQKYLYAFRAAYPCFAADFPEMEDYLTVNYRFLSNEQKTVVDGVDENSVNNYEPVRVGTGSDYVEILGKAFHKKTAPANVNSDFEIDTGLYRGSKKPLVLPVEPGNQYTHLRYTQALWGKNDKAPYFDDTPWQQRTLPCDGSPYPYLTISDFLEDTIVRVNNRFNSEAFFDGNDEKGRENSFLLPLKPLYFDFFTTAGLQGAMPNGKKAFELQRLGTDSVKAILRIPVRKGFITYERIYFASNESDRTNNRGAILEEDFAFALFPNVRFARAAEAHYRLTLAGSEKKHYSLSCGAKWLEPVVRNVNYVSEHEQSRTYVVEHENFDYIRLTAGNVPALIIPVFKPLNGHKTFTFAVDFGTTNTHIEYCIDNLPAKPLDITERDRQLNFLHTDYGKLRKQLLENDFIPLQLGEQAEFSLPTRTVLSIAETTDWDKPVVTLGHVNIPFPYEKRRLPRYNDPKLGLKWSNRPYTGKQINCYIENLFLIMRNKVILNNGNLAGTRIVWFYPISMTMNKYNGFKTIWDNGYRKYFGPDLNHIIAKTESIAPYDFYKQTHSAVSDIVTIDIGGATTDVVMAQGNTGIRYITSFRFAADDIFGDAYTTATGHNGIVCQYNDAVSRILKANGEDDLCFVHEDLLRRKVSADIASFFFSLKSNKALAGKNIDLDFNDMLYHDDRQKIVFVIFFAAIIYHLALIMKAKGLPLPRHIAFSGNGSKILRILDVSPDSKVIEHYTKLIFRQVYRCDYHPDGLTIIRDLRNSKESTCKGGILNFQQEDYQTINDKKISLLGVDGETFVDNRTYGDIHESVIQSVAGEMERFFQLVFERNKTFSYFNHFGVSGNSFQIAEDVCRKDIITYINKGLQQRKAEIEAAGADSNVEETLFFYPLKGVLNALTSRLYCSQKQ